MDFISLAFIIFLVITFIFYYLFGFIKFKWKKFPSQWIVLLIASLIFYGFADYRYLIYIGVSACISYLCALSTQYKVWKKESDDPYAPFIFIPSFVEKNSNRRKYEEFITLVAIVLNVGLLSITKYYNFAIQTLNSLFKSSLDIKNFIIPLGISFYTFSLVSYNIDVLRRETIAEKNPFKFILFVTYFPKILQGPISSYNKLNNDGLFASHKLNDVDYSNSFFRISIGLVKKIVIANILGLYVDTAYSNIIASGSFELFVISVFYFIQLYCDFSGFMDIALGISSLFGIKLEENFNVPFISSSVQMFWRRWHITLGAWLKKYIYIPLGGNRVKPVRWVINTLIIWLISGLWHGANLTFIIWGLIHGILLIIEGLPKQIRKSKGLPEPEVKEERKIIQLLRVFLTFIVVNFSFIFFRSSSLNEAGQFIKGIFSFNKIDIFYSFTSASLLSSNWILIVSTLAVIILILLLAYKNRIGILRKINLSNKVEFIVKYLLTIIFVTSAIFMFFYVKSIGGGGSSFIYFEF